MRTPVTAAHLVERIYLSWRTGAGKPRLLIGRFDRVGDVIDFEYLRTPDIVEAVNKGCQGYPGLNIAQSVHKDVLDIIANRLIDKQRSDRIRYLQHWNAADVAYDDFDLLALTQAWLTNDRFEFLADFQPKDGLSFITDLAGQSHYAVNKEAVLSVRNKALTYELESIEGYDHPVVHIINSEKTFIGNIKRVHNWLFSHNEISNFNIDLSLVNTEHNGVLNKVFVQVKLTSKRG